MALPRQKKRSRSISASQPKKRSRILSGRTRRGKKKINFPGGNAVVAQNWDRSLTVEQNYRRLGLVGRLNGVSGGVERRGKMGGGEGGGDVFAIGGVGGKWKGRGDVAVVPTEVRVERDEETGAIVRVVRPEEQEDGGRKKRRRLDDSLNVLDSDSDEGEGDDGEKTVTTIQPAPRLSTSIISQLESQADLESTRLAQQRRPRHQSRREEEWIAAMVAKYGTDEAAVKAMARDKKLNVMQQSEGDIRRRVSAWVEKHRNGG